MIEETNKKLSPNTHTSGVPAIKIFAEKKEDQSKKGMNILMLACCIPMVIGGALILYSIPAGTSLGARLYALAPFAGCLAMHVVMHRFIGKSCHQKTTKED